MVDGATHTGTVGCVGSTTVERSERATVVTTLCLARLRLHVLVDRVPQRDTLISYAGAVLDRLIADAVAGRRAGLSADLEDLRRAAAETLGGFGPLDDELAHAARVVEAAYG